jgi:hypothetical protein
LLLCLRRGASGDLATIVLTSCYKADIAGIADIARHRRTF